MRTATSKARATGCAGERTATVLPPPVTTSGTRSRFGSTSVSGPGQKRSASLVGAFRPLGGQRAGLSFARYVNDERVAGRAALRLKDTRRRQRIQRIGAEAIDRLGGKSHQLAALQQLRRGFDGFSLRVNRIYLQDDRIDVMAPPASYGNAHPNPLSQRPEGAAGRG